MNRHLFIYILLCILPARLWADGNVFSDSLLDKYRDAIALNDKKDFLEAYKAMASVERAMLKEMEVHNITALQLSDQDLQYPYWQVKKSMAEIAYMLGNHVVMGRISNELHDILSKHKWEDAEEGNAWTDGCLADMAKIDGSRYYLLEKYDSAETSLLTALRLRPLDSSGDDFKSKTMADLAQLYYKEEEYDKALACLDSVIASQYYNPQGWNWTSQKAKELKEIQSQRAICLARLGKYSEALATISPILAYYKSTDRRSYAETLRKKAKILMLKYDHTGSYDPSALACYNEYLAIAKAYIDSHFTQMNESEREQYWMAEQPFVTDCYRLEDKAPSLLYDVALFSKAILLQMGRTFTSTMNRQQRAQALSSMRVTWRQVQQTMPPGSIAIEFIAYDKGSKKYIGALVLSKSGKPSFVPIASIDSIANHELPSGYTVGQTFALTKDNGAINALYNDSTLADVIWNRRLVQIIGKNNKVYFAPDGIFHQIAIEYLLPNALSTKKIYRLTTTRLLTQRHSKVRSSSMLMAGGVDYQKTNSDVKGERNDEIAYTLMASMGMRLPYLAGTRAEVDSVRALRGTAHKDAVVVADTATEQAVRQLMEKYHVLLISTHGYFSAATTIGTDIRPAETDEQLSKSCIFLAGAEANMRDKQFDASHNDGILSARELASMNLSQVDLTVLSACMSGLGYITPDGVYGLQRGLKAAGVKAVITSLWEVNDQATNILMRNLFGNLNNGMSLYEAFRQARQTLHDTVLTKRYSARLVRKTRLGDPYYCNAFILIDGQE